MKETAKKTPEELIIFFIILGLTAFGLALSNDIISNYFKDAYQVTAYQRGLIEFPRELPGILVVVMISLMSGVSDIRMSILAQILSIVGLMVLSVWTPGFSVMLVFIFMNSLGMHLFGPLHDSLGLALIRDGNVGKTMGQFKGVYTGMTMVGGLLVFLGFRNGLFSFETSVKWPFIIASAAFIIVLLLLFRLNRLMPAPPRTGGKIRFVIRRKYKYYYMLVLLFGVQKQIMLVYGPWVLIDMLGKGADTIAVLGIIGAGMGIVFIPRVGEWIDRLGLRKVLFLDGFTFIGVFLAFGVLTAGFQKGFLPMAGIPVAIAYLLIIMDKLSNQMGMVRVVYLRSIAEDPDDITPTFSLGLAMDHVVAIVCAFLGGIVWGTLGPQYIFFFATALSLVNLYVASHVEQGPIATEDG